MGANIAEGCGKEGNRELHRFLQIASGSASELEYELLLARDLKYMADAEYQGIERNLVELRRMLTALMQKIRTDTLVTTS